MPMGINVGLADAQTSKQISFRAVFDKLKLQPLPQFSLGASYEIAGRLLLISYININWKAFAPSVF